MERSDYLKLTAEIFDRWPNNIWSDAMIAKWWSKFSPLPIQACAQAVDRLQAEGHGPFTPDPGLVLRYARAAMPGGARYAVGAHAAALVEMAETVATREEASAAISACRALLADRNAKVGTNAAEEAAEGP